MVLLEWNESYSVGNKEIDTQHKEWLRIINSLHTRLIGEGDQGLAQATTEALKAVMSYSEKHFQFEERMMEEAGYEDLLYHQKLHAEFYNRINRLYEKHTSGEIILNSQLMKTLQSWLLDHILFEDKKFAEKL